MRTYHQYKNSQESIQGVGEMVRTIEKIAASRLKNLSDEVRRLDAYHNELVTVLSRLSDDDDVSDQPLFSKRNQGKTLLVILGGNKGLVGGLNHRLVNRYMEKRGEYTALAAVGRRANQLLMEEGITADRVFAGAEDAVDEQSLKEITTYLFDEYGKGTWRRVDVLYAHYQTIAVQQPVIEQYLPFTFGTVVIDQSEDAAASDGWPVCEPSRGAVFRRFLEYYIRIRLYKLYLEAKLSELSARTIEMEHAASKADDMLVKLRHSYIKERRMNATLKQLSSFIVSSMV